MNRFVSYNDIYDGQEFLAEYGPSYNGYINDSLIINNDDLFYYLNDKDVVKIDGIDISMYLLINTLLSDVIYEHVMTNINHHKKDVISLIIADDKISYTYPEFRKIINHIGIADLLHYYNRILGDIPATTKALIQSRLGNYKLYTRYENLEENHDVSIGPILDKKIMEVLKPELSDMELVIALYIKMCTIINYNKDSKINYISITDNAVNKDTFMNIFKFYLSRIGIDYDIDDKGNVVITSGEYTVNLVNNDMTLAFDMECLTKISGLVPCSHNKVSDTKFKEMANKMLNNAYTEAKNRHDSQAALERYRDHYLNCHLSITEKLQVFLNKLARNDIQGSEAMPYYATMFKRVFSNENIDLIFLSDLDSEINLCNRTPLIVLKLHSGENRYIVIKPVGFEVRQFDELGFREFVSDKNYEVINKGYLGNGEKYVRQVTKKS